ncbi:MAG: sodium/solute symporter, partial [Pirellulaceae bacterium]
EQLPTWDGPGRSHAIGVAQAGQFLLFSGRRRNAQGEFELLTDAHRFDPAAYARERSRARPDRDGKIVLPSYANGWTRVADIAPVHPDNPTETPQPRCVMAGSGIAWGYDFVLLFGGSKGERFLRREQEYPARIAQAEQNGDAAEVARLTAEANAIYDEHTGFSGDILAYHLTTDRWTWRGTMPGPTPVTTSTVRWNSAVVLPTGESIPGVRTPSVSQATATHSARVFGWANWSVLAVYLVGLVAVGIYCSRAGGEDQDFFLAGGKIPWWAAGVSIFATMLSAITYLSIPARSYGTNWSWFLVNMGIPIVCVLVIYLYLPFFRRLRVASAYHYLEQRFDLGLRLLGSTSFILFQLGRMGVVVLLPALALSAVTGVDVFVCIMAMGALSTLYTVLGGMAAVIWTDVVQVVVLIGGAILALMVMASQIDGGLMGIWTIAAAEGKTALVNDFHFHDLAWSHDGILVILMGAIFTNLLPYTSDQAVIQRYLTVADQAQARRALWGNAVIVIPASILFFSVGTAIWVFYKTHPLNLVPLDKPDQIFPWLISSEMPPGLAGLVIAGVFAAAMSSLDSSMHSIATAATTDFYGRLGSPKTAEQTLRMAKLLTLVLGVFGTGSAMVLATLDIQFLWDLFLSIVGLFLGTLAGLFTLGIFSARATAIHAWIGAIASVLVLAWCRWGTEMHGLLYGGIALVVCCGVGILASWIVPSGATVDKTLTLHGLTATDRD